MLRRSRVGDEQCQIGPLDFRPRPGDADLLDGLVADEEAEGLPVLRTNTLMDTPESRAGLARAILDFAGSL